MRFSVVQLTFIPVFPVVVSVRQRLREKHARHVADLKAYYETEIQLLQDKLKLGDLPQDVEKANETLTKRCVVFVSVSFLLFFSTPLELFSPTDVSIWRRHCLRPPDVSRSWRPPTALWRRNW